MCVSHGQQVSAMAESPRFGMDAFDSLSRTVTITRHMHRIK